MNVWEKIKKFFMWLGGIVAAVAAFLFLRGTFGRRVDDSEGVVSDLKSDNERKRRLDERQRDLAEEQRGNTERQRDIVERQSEAVDRERELNERERELNQRERGALEGLGKVIESVEARRNT
jgi:hypothetical protein